MKSKTAKRQVSSVSNSSVYSISDEEEIPVTKKSRKHSENRHSHKIHRQQHRHRSSESLSDDEIDSKCRVKVKEEPLSDIERERKYKSKHSR